MSNNDDKYTRESDRDSQVRTIIKQLNEESPSREKSREVVVRPDGSKMVRVVKKRKVMVSREEKSRRARHTFLQGLLVFILLLAGIIGFFAYRMTVMSGDSYLQEREVELCKAWGAVRVHCEGAHIDGLELKIDSIVAEFPETGNLERVELDKIKCTLDTSTFFSGILRSDEVKIEHASIRLREGSCKLEVPHWQGGEFWKFKRVACDALDFSLGEPERSPVLLSGAEAYMYYPHAGSSARVVILKGGLLKMRGWKPITLLDGKLQVSSHSIEDIRLTGTTDSSSLDGDGLASHITISGRQAVGESLAGPLMFDADNVNFTEFSAGRFTRFFSATVVSAAQGRNKPAAFITLPLEKNAPEFKGAFKLRDIRITSFPALLEITSHIEPAKRKGYLPPKILQGRAELSREGSSLVLSIAENDMKQLDLISLSGRLAVDENNTLSGHLNYGIPSLLTHVEYPDGGADPIFQDDGVLAWLRTTVSGQANAPTDNSQELDAMAEEARLKRPARTPFDQLDVDAFSQRVKEGQGNGSYPQPSGTQETTGKPAFSSPSADSAPKRNSGNPFAEPDDPFENGGLAPSSSSSGGLTLPVDSSVFPRG